MAAIILRSCQLTTCRLSACSSGLTNYNFSTSNTAQSIKVSDSNGIRTITLSDPKTRNALSTSMITDLSAALAEKSSDLDLRCVVLKAEGNVFSSGHNLKHMIPVEGRSVIKQCNELMISIVQLPIPVIAAVDGLAAAAGCQLVAQCDIAVATKRSQFSTPGASFGVFCSTPGIPLVRSVSLKASADMLFTGLPITAEQALTFGLISRIAQDGQLDETVQQITDAIKTKSRSVIELGKRFLYRQIELGLRDAYREGGDVMLRNLELPDGEEGLNSFAEKRKPVWSHIDKK